MPSHMKGNSEAGDAMRDGFGSQNTFNFLWAGNRIVPITPRSFNCDYQRLEMVAPSRHPQSNQPHCLMRLLLVAGRSSLQKILL